MSKGPVLIELDDTPEVTPATAPPVPEPELGEAAMGRVAALAARRPSRLARWFWGAAVALVGFVASVAAWDFVTDLLARSPLLGWVALGLVALFCLVLTLVALREVAALFRLRRVDQLQRKVLQARETGGLRDAQAVLDDLRQLYDGRADCAWGQGRIAERAPDIMDGPALLDLAEDSLLVPLDARARAEVEAAARRVATVTALVPIALADLLTALTSNIGMIRRIAEIYGGRSGTLGSWRLTRAVLTHLVATGAVAVGDDLIGSVAGGGVLSRVSRRFGEGVINGALTARVGVAAMEVCRPMAFHAVPRPSVSALVRRALTGLFARGQGVDRDQDAGRQSR